MYQASRARQVCSPFVPSLSIAQRFPIFKRSEVLFAKALTRSSTFVHGNRCRAVARGGVRERVAKSLETGAFQAGNCADLLNIVLSDRGRAARCACPDRRAYPACADSEHGCPLLMRLTPPRQRQSQRRITKPIKASLSPRLRGGSPLLRGRLRSVFNSKTSFSLPMPR